FFARGDFRRWCDQQNVSNLALVETLRLQNQLQRLVPRYVLQTQRDAARNGVARDEVEVGEVGDQLQHRADFDVLEVQRQLFTFVPEDVVALREFLVADRIHVDRQSLVGLI